MTTSIPTPEPRPVCAVTLGHASDTPADFREITSGLTVCARHRRQYDERPDLGPFVWMLA